LLIKKGWQSEGIVIADRCFETIHDVLNLTGFRAKEQLHGASIGIIPMGSIEFHGPHAPLGTDSIIATALAEKVAKKLGGILFPLIAYTPCPPTTREYPGTISVKPETMIRYLAELFRGVLATGVKRILVLNAHDGNIEAVRAAGETIRGEFPDRFILLINWWETLPESFVNSLGLFSQHGGHGHGGPLETSVVQAIRSEAVDLTHGKDIDVKPGTPDEMVHMVCKGDRLGAWAGYHGRISEASKEKGEILIEESVKRVVKAVQEWIGSNV